MNERSPSNESKNHLKEMTKTFPPLDVKFLPALNSDSSMEECIEDADFIVTGLKKYVESGHSTANLEKYFGEIEVY